MQRSINDKISASIRGFKLPDYHSIPDVGLYLEQTVRYISDCLSPLPNISITGSMVANYVKKDMIDNPVKKQYSREQIAYLFFIVLAKSVLSLEDIQLMIHLQKNSYTPQRAYEYFVREFTNLLYYVFGLKENLDSIGVDNTEEKTMLRNTIVTVAHKIYLDKFFEVSRQAAAEEDA